MRLSSDIKTAAASGVGVLGAILGDVVGLVSTGGDVVMAFILGASGAAGGYVVKELITAARTKLKSTKKQ